MERQWQRASNFTPSIFLAPILVGPNAGGKKEIEAAKGLYVVGTLVGFKDQPNNYGSNSHFWEINLEETNVGNAQVFSPEGDGKTGTYTAVPIVAGNVYSIKASEQLHANLLRYVAGQPVKITYQGVKTYQDAKGDTRTAHQYMVDFDPSFVPPQLAAPTAVEAPQIEYDDAVEPVEEPI